MQKGGALSMEEGVVGSALNDVSQVETSFKKPSAKLSVLPKIFIVFAIFFSFLTQTPFSRLQYVQLFPWCLR